MLSHRDILRDVRRALKALPDHPSACEVTRVPGAHATCDDCASATERCARVVYESGGAEEAQDRLCRADLYPWTPGDETAPRWWCEGCEGTGLAAVDAARGRKVYRCGECDIAGHTADPPSLPALVAVASLGVERLRAAEGLTQEIAAHAGCREARLVWRVMGREAIEMHHVRICSDQAWRGGSPTLPEVASVEEAICIDGGAWSWHAAEDWSDSTARAAWPALRDLHALGLHLVALDASRIVLAVEAIGGDRG